MVFKGSASKENVLQSINVLVLFFRYNDKTQFVSMESLEAELLELEEEIKEGE